MLLYSGKNKVVLYTSIILLLFSCPSLSKQALEQVSLQLDWKFQYKFAGFIMAKEKGFYREAGLSVKFNEYQAGMDTVTSVLSQQHNYGLYDSTIAIEEGQLKPTILMATYFQQSPLAFATSKDIKHPKDLIGKKIMLDSTELKYSSLALMLNHFFINQSNAKIVPHSFSMDDFISGEVDAVSIYNTTQPFELNNSGIDYNIIEPSNYGFLTTSVNLFTSLEEASKHPERSRKFVDATNKGWAYALAHPEETINIIHQKYASNQSIEALRFEAHSSKEKMMLDLFNIGEVNMELSLRLFKQLKFNNLVGPNETFSSFLLEDTLKTLSNASHLTYKQLTFLKQKKQITMCAAPDWMPIEAIKNSQHLGITHDIFDQFKQHLPIPILLIPTESWQQSITYAKKRRCDILSIASKTPERSIYMDFTEPYLTSPVVLATKMDTVFINDLRQVLDKKIGIIKNHSLAETLQRDFPGINLVEVDSVNEGLSRVESGKLFAYIDTLMVISHAIQQNFTGQLKVSARLKNNLALSVGTRNDQPELKNIFNTLINNISDEQRQAIYNKWVPLQQTPPFDYDLLWKALTFILILMAAFCFHYFKLTKLNRLLLTQSTTDKLTNLYNRAKIDQVLLEKKSDVNRYQTDITIILLDIDYFKAINDTHGHLIGDQVLVQFAQLIKSNVRANDSVGRWGGEEFIIICPNTTLKDATELTNKLLLQIRNYPFKVADKITASAGISQLSSDDNIQKSIRNADSALYQAKKNGRDQAIAYNQKDS